GGEILLSWSPGPPAARGEREGASRSRGFSAQPPRASKGPAFVMASHEGMGEPSDGRLLAAWSRGESGAFEALVTRHERALLRHARSLLGDWRAGEDVVQEAFLRLAQRPPVLDATVQGDPRAEAAVLSSWLHQVTRNLCMDEKRSAMR